MVTINTSSTSVRSIASGFTGIHQGQLRVAIESRLACVSQVWQLQEQNQHSLWEQLPLLLDRVSVLNQTQPVPADDFQEIEHLVEKITSTSNEQELLMVLQMLSEHIFFGTKALYLKVLELFKEKVPKTKDYLLDGDPILKPAAVEKILQFFEKEYGFSVGMLSCQKVSDLPRLVQEMLDSPHREETRGWVVYNPPEDPHLTPVFLYKAEGKIRILVCDSKGHLISSQHKKWEMCESLRVLIQAFKYRSEVLDQLEIYSYKEKRQRDGVSCPIFSLLDLKNLVERHELEMDIFSFFWSDEIAPPRQIMHEIADDSDLRLYEVKTLPPEMMKITQSYSQLESYRRDSPAFTKIPVPCFLRPSPTGDKRFVFQTIDQLKQTTSSYGFISSEDGVKVNKYVEKKRWTYIVHLLSHLVKAESNTIYQK